VAKKEIKKHDLLPSYLKPSYLPKIKVDEDHSAPVENKHLFRIAIIAFSLFMAAKAATKEITKK
jgi:hypothetical protein